MKKKYIIEVEMEERWFPHLRGMLEKLQELGNTGSSRRVAIMSDGDGNFRPKFTFQPEDPKAEPPAEEGLRYQDIDYLFDAG